MEKVAIIGFGRFGKTLYRLLQDSFDLVLYDIHPEAFNDFELNDHSYIAKSFEDVFTAKTLIFSVPISQFEKTLKDAKVYLNNHYIIDVLSVKTYPHKIFSENLDNTGCKVLLTHPMFGPDSSKNGFGGLPIVVDRSMSDFDSFEKWKSFFEQKGLRVVEMSCETHDRLAARSQGVTHFIGRILEKYGFSPTEIDTLGAKKLAEVKEQTCNDTWELFLNLQTYNPFTKEMRLKIGEAYDDLYNLLLPQRVSDNFLTIGIQGGIGSFNEEAVKHYLKMHNVTAYDIKYLYTTDNVLKELSEGNIDIGQFAIENTLGGVVGESLIALAKHKVSIIEEFYIKIRHCLMVKKGTGVSDVTTIMAHPQVLKQCKGNLSKSYPNLKQVSGEGELIDTARAAKALSEGTLDSSVAILGPQGLADLYGFDTIAQDLQDSTENFTTFLIVSRL